MSGQLASVYRCFDSGRSLIYVGITGGGAQRIRGHAHSSHWWPRVHTMTVDHFATRDEARDEELLAIEVERPRFNVEGTSRSHWIDAIQDAMVAGYYEDQARLRRALTTALDRRDRLVAMAAQLELLIDDGEAALRALRRGQR